MSEISDTTRGNFDLREGVSARGFVLRADPQGEFDKRLTILTGELGKITAFVRGARRVTSSFLAVTNPFAFAEFDLYEGKNAYSLMSFKDAEYFDGIAKLDPGVYYGYYFLELASFYGQDGLEAYEMVNLLYAAFKALMRQDMPNEMIKAVFECRMMSINGDYAVPEDAEGTVKYALNHCVTSPVSNLFSFDLKENSAKLFMESINKTLKKTTGGNFKSLAVLGSMNYNGLDGSR